MDKARIVPPLVLWLLSLGFLLMGGRLAHGAGAMPVLVGSAMLVLTSFDLATCLPGGLSAQLRALLNPARPRRHSAARPALVGCALVVLVSGGLVGFGVMASVPLFVLVALRFGADRDWSFSLAGAAIVTLAVWLLFARLLGLTLFPGLLFGGEW